MNIKRILLNMDAKTWIIIILGAMVLTSSGLGWNENRKVKRMEKERTALDLAYQEILKDLSECLECQKNSDIVIADLKKIISEMESDQIKLIKSHKHELKKLNRYINSLGDDDLIKLFTETFGGEISN